MLNNSNSPHKTDSMSTLKGIGHKILSPSHAAEHPQSGTPGTKLSEGHKVKVKASSPTLSLGHHISSAIFNRKSSTTTSNPPIPLKPSSSLSNLVSHSSNPFSKQTAELIGTGTSISSRRDNRDTHRHKGHLNDQNDHPLKSKHLHNENIIYNPYGINNNNNISASNSDLSFYMQDGDENIKILPLPIADPNSFLSDDMKEYSVLLTDNFTFDSENKTLGAGSSSEVKRVKSAYNKKELYALKKLHTVYHETPEKFYKRCSKEFIIAKQASQNIHVVSTFYLMKVPTTSYSTRGWGFVMEICVGDLFQLIEKTGWKNVPLAEKFCIFKQIAQGVRFIHSIGIAHRDIKPENILLTKEGVCKLTDFGISDWFHVDPTDLTSPIKTCEGIVGSTPYSPPEVMLYDDKKSHPKYLKKPYSPIAMDCYALGILFFALVNGYLPFAESSTSDARFREYEVSYDNFIHYQNKNFREKGSYKSGPGNEYRLSRAFLNTDGSRACWRLADPIVESRYTMDDLFNDPWFQGVESCIDGEDKEETKQLEARAPELRNKSSDIDMISGSSLSPVTSITSDNGSIHSNSASHSPTPVGRALQKPRSMVEIAQSPNFVKHRHEKKSHGHKDAIDYDSRIQDLENPKILFTLNKNDDNESIQGKLQAKTLDEMMDEGDISKSLEKELLQFCIADTPTTMSLSSASSVASGKTKKKHVIHNHMEISNSFQQNSMMRCFSDK